MYLRVISTLLFLSESATASLLSLSVDEGHSKDDTGHSDGIIPENYSPLIPPPMIDGKPTQAGFSILVMNVRDIRETTQELSLEMNLRVYWSDTRLQNLTGDKEFLVLNPSFMQEKIWKPDVFIDHVKSVSVPFLMSKPASLRLFATGQIRYSARLTVVMSCRMNFKYYPMDTQNCVVDMKSYAYISDILMLNWYKGVSAFAPENLTLPNFYLRLTNADTFTTASTSGVYSGIRFTVRLQRKITYHILQTYFPSTLFIVVSWLTFVIPSNLGACWSCMMSLLTITTMFGSIRQNTPSVSYAKALDIWMVSCMFFNFLCLIHHAVTLKLRNLKIRPTQKGESKLTRKIMRSMRQTSQPRSGSEDSTVVYRVNGKNSLEMRNMQNDADLTAKNNDEEEKAKKIIQEYRRIGNKIRRIFAIGTPILFGVFNLIYWPWIIVGSGYFD